MAFDKMTLAQARKAAENAKKTVAYLRKKAEDKGPFIFGGIESGSAAFITGAMNGRFGGPGRVVMIGGKVPVDAAAALALWFSGFFDAFGKYSEHAMNVGAGIGAAVAYRMGVELGVSTATAPQHATSGVLPPYTAYVPFAPSYQAPTSPQTYVVPSVAAAAE